MTRNILDSEYNAGFDFGVSSERERIIKLLEDNCECDFDSRCCQHGHVTLIKGESQKYNETVSLLTDGENK